MQKAFIFAGADKLWFMTAGFLLDRVWPSLIPLAKVAVGLLMLETGNAAELAVATRLFVKIFGSFVCLSVTIDLGWDKITLDDESLQEAAVFVDETLASSVIDNVGWLEQASDGKQGQATAECVGDTLAAASVIVLFISLLSEVVMEYVSTGT